MKTSAPRRRSSIAGRSACASATGARRLTSSARSMWSCSSVCEAPRCRQRRAGDQHVDLAGRRGERARRRRARRDPRRSRARRAPPRARRAPRRGGRSARSCAPSRASRRASTVPMPPVAPVSSTRAPAIATPPIRRRRAATLAEKVCWKHSAADRADLARGEEAGGRGVREHAREQRRVVIGDAEHRAARGRCR